MRPWYAYWFIACVVTACSQAPVTITHGNLCIQYNDQLHTQIASVQPQAQPFMKGYAPSEYLVMDHDTLVDFNFISMSSQSITDSLGEGTRWMIQGRYAQPPVAITKIIQLHTYQRFPDEAFVTVAYVNQSSQAVAVQAWGNHHYNIRAGADSVPFWSFQGESTEARKDWILPITPGFYQRNYMGMNHADYGGGIPVIDLWRKDQGIGIGHAETIPTLLSLPVKADSLASQVDLQITQAYDRAVSLLPGDTLHTYQTFVTVHSGDCFRTLQQYGNVLRAKGIHFAPPEPAAFESSWCAWGYMRDFTMEEIRGTIPKVKELGIKWVTIDDGFQQAEGDWHINQARFPGGDQQLRDLVADLHAQGLKVMLWWTPLAADSASHILQAQPELVLRNADGTPRNITWWDAWYLSPADSATWQYTRETLALFFEVYDIDGLKMDGQHLNAVPPDYNPAHHLADPTQAVEALPAFFKMIYTEARRYKPSAVVQLCPCGTCMSPFNMPYTNLTVASDPLNSWQVRLKGKTIKAIMPDHAYFGDHVELSDGRCDFASSMGVGAVIGSKFTWPKENPAVEEDNLLTPAREATWKKWFDLYHQKMLSKAHYRGELYDIGYDLPETHVLQKGDTLYYAFYNTHWRGPVALRGLVANTYHVRDYENNQDLGVITRANPVLPVAFKDHLLLAAYPAAADRSETVKE